MPRPSDALVVDAPPEPLGAHLRACRMAAAPTPAEREARRRRGAADPPTGLTLDELAGRLAAVGHPTTKSALSKLEQGRGSDARWSRARRVAAACGFDLRPALERIT